MTATTDNGRVVLPGVIAVIGCDGSGKSTLTRDLMQQLGQRGNIERRYLGLVSGEAGNRIKHLPIIGVALERYLAAKARRAQDRRQKLPGTGTALVMYLLSLWRTRQFRRMVELAHSGVWVLADRYPQAEIPGFNYDGPALPGAGIDNWLVRRLAPREQRLYTEMARYLPSLILRLNVDIETALSRKPDHIRAEVQDKIAVAAQLHFNGAYIVDIDARQPYSEVLAQALAAIAVVLTAPTGGSTP